MRFQEKPLQYSSHITLLKSSIPEPLYISCNKPTKSPYKQTNPSPLEDPLLEVSKRRRHGGEMEYEVPPLLPPSFFSLSSSRVWVGKEWGEKYGAPLL